MSVDKTITGVVSDSMVKEQMAGYAKNLSPVQDNDGRLAYASLLLAWVLEGTTQNFRYTRANAIWQVYINHMSDRCLGINHGSKVDTSITYPDFMIEVEKFLEFLS